MWGVEYFFNMVIVNQLVLVTFNLTLFILGSQFACDWGQVLFTFQFIFIYFQLVGENEQYEQQIKVLCSKQSCDLTEADYGSTDDSKEVKKTLIFFIHIHSRNEIF